MYPYLSGVNYESVVDGPGIRAAIFLSGCKHLCPGCHNPQTHNPQFGSQLNNAMIYTIAYSINNRDYIDGITLTGGDPLYNIEATFDFLMKLRNDLGDRWNKLNVWLYTGYTWAQLIEKRKTDYFLKTLLSMIDVVVDGPYVELHADKTLAFRGSANQRIIDVKKSIEQNQIVLWNNER